MHAGSKPLRTSLNPMVKSKDHLTETAIPFEDEERERETPLSGIYTHRHSSCMEIATFIDVSECHDETQIPPQATSEPVTQPPATDMGGNFSNNASIKTNKSSLLFLDNRNGSLDKQVSTQQGTGPGLHITVKSIVLLQQ